MNLHSSKGQGGRLTPRDMALGEDSSLGRGASQNRPFISLQTHWSGPTGLRAAGQESPHLGS